MPLRRHASEVMLRERGTALLRGRWKEDFLRNIRREKEKAASQEQVRRGAGEQEKGAAHPEKAGAFGGPFGGP
jgi:hypothetical protein